MRPGELVTSWVEERLDAARPGSRPPSPAAPDALAALAARLDDLSRRMDALTAAPVADAPVADAAAPVKRRPGRPRKALVAPADATEPAPRRRRAQAGSKRAGGKKVPLHAEISAVIAERGPQTAAELATAIVERGNYAPPRSARPLDAASVNARVSNPKYRPLFVRREGRIGLAE